MNLKLLVIIQMILTFILSIPAFATIQTITHTIQQPFGGSQTPDDARIAGVARAKREALEKAATYIESISVVKNSQLDRDEMLAVAAGATKAEVIKQKNFTNGDTFGIEITVEMKLDTAVFEKSLKGLLDDRNHLNELKAAREREKKLLARIAELEKENQQKGKDRLQVTELKENFKAASQELAAMDWYLKTIALWDGKKLSDPKKAIEYLSQAISLDPNLSAAYYDRGIAYSRLKQFDQAIADYDLVIRLVPSFVQAYNNRGLAYYDHKQFDRAIADQDQAIRLDPNFAPAYNNRGIAYAALKQIDQAITNYDKAIRLDPNDAATYLNRGKAYDVLDKINHAITDYDHAIRIDPNFADAYEMRGIGYLMLNQAEKGCADLGKACMLGVCKGYELSRQEKMCR